MTFREKYMEEHPNMNPSEAVEMGCPCDFGYETETNDCPEGIRTCSICWDREIPEEKTVADAIQEGLANPDERIVSAFKQLGEEASKTMDALERMTTNAPKILDSGNRRQFESGAVRDIQEGKGRCDLLPLDVVADIYEEFFPEEPELCRVSASINMFKETGDVTYLYHALDSFIEKPFGAWSNMFLEVAIHFEEGAKKYGENNWQKGIPVHCYIDSAVRHYLKFLRGDKDEPHDRAFCWNILCAIWTCKHKWGLNEYAVKDEKDDGQTTIDGVIAERKRASVAKAYDTLVKARCHPDVVSDVEAIETAIGYLGEVLDG